MSSNTSSLTVRSNGGVFRAIVTECEIKSSHPGSTQVSRHKAVWDTGATNSVISPSVVKQLGLTPIGKTRTSTPNGIRNADTFLINIKIDSNVTFTDIRVTEGDMEGIDVLIGMDIIVRGDFVLTNMNGNSVFSFRVPSITDIDFVKEWHGKQEPFKATESSRNKPCPCGSGKKYKRCCGANAV